MVATYPRQFTGRTIVARKTFFKNNIPPGYQKVTLESPEFMSLFDVYSTDQMDARMCLQTDIMLNLCNLAKRDNANIEVSFANQKIFLALHTPKNSFEIGISKTILENRIYDQFAGDVIELLNIVRNLKLQ